MGIKIYLQNVRNKQKEGSSAVVKPITGWTRRGDEYRIEGGRSYIKEDACYHIVFIRIDRIREIWNVPSKGISLELLMQKLEGPYSGGESGPFGRKFLEKYGKLILSRRLPPKF